MVARYYGLKPDIKVISPWREWDLNSRTKLIQYAESKGIAVPQSKRGEPPFSQDANLLHISYEGCGAPKHLLTILLAEHCTDSSGGVQLAHVCGPGLSCHNHRLTRYGMSCICVLPASLLGHDTLQAGRKGASPSCQLGRQKHGDSGRQTSCGPGQHLITWHAPAWSYK